MHAVGKGENGKVTIQQDDGVEAAEVPEGDGSFDRRSFLKTGLGVAGFAAATAVLGACTSDDGEQPHPQLRAEANLMLQRRL